MKATSPVEGGGFFFFFGGPPKAYKKRKDRRKLSPKEEPDTPTPQTSTVQSESVLKPSVYVHVKKRRNSLSLSKSKSHSIKRSKAKLKRKKSKSKSSKSSKTKTSKSSQSRTSLKINDILFGVQGPAFNGNVNGSQRKEHKKGVQPKQIGTSLSKKSSEYRHSRKVFVSLRSFYDSWRKIHSELLFHAIVIVPDIEYQWILQPRNKKFIKLHNYHDIFTDIAFLKILIWKHNQGLLICGDFRNQLNCIQEKPVESESEAGLFAPFWYRLSNKLVGLKYNPLILDAMYYKNQQLFTSKYGLQTNEMLKGLQSPTINTSIIKEVLYQSNPTLQIFNEQQSQNNNAALTENWGLLDELSMVSQDEKTEKDKDKDSSTKDEKKESDQQSWLDHVDINCDSLLKQVLDYGLVSIQESPIDSPISPLEAIGTFSTDLDLDDDMMETPIPADNITPFSSASIYKNLHQEREIRHEVQQALDEQTHQLVLSAITGITSESIMTESNRAHDDSVLESTDWWIDAQYYHQDSMDFDHVDSIKVNGHIIDLTK